MEMKIINLYGNNFYLRIFYFAVAVMVSLMCGTAQPQQALKISPAHHIPAQQTMSSQRNIQPHWEPAGFSAGGFFPMIAVDPVQTNTLYLASDVSGIYKSTDYGETWKIINNGLDSREVSNIVIDPSNHLRLWAGTPMGLYSSNNAGESWSLVRSDICCLKHVNYKGIAVSKDGQNLIVASHTSYGEQDAGTFTGKLYQSTDGGATWAIVKEFPHKEIRSVMLDPYVPDQAFMLVAQQGVYRSADGGKTWKYFSNWLPKNSDWKGMDIGKSLIYVTAPLTKPFKSKKNFFSWWVPIRSNLEIEGNYLPYDTICVSPDNDNIVYLGQEGYPSVLYKSINAGKSWKGSVVPDSYTSDTVHAPYQTWFNPWQAPISIAIDPVDPNRVYYTNWVDIWKSQDGGETWRSIVVGTQNTCCTDIRFAGETLLASHMDVGVFTSKDYGATWLAGIPNKGHDMSSHAWGIEEGGGGKIYAAFSVDNQGVIIFRSDDGGMSWEDKAEGLPIPAQEGSQISIAADPNNPAKLYLSIHDMAEKGLYHTSNYGETWEHMKHTPGTGACSGSSRIKCLEVDPTDSKRIFAGLYFEGLWFSQDAGETWKPAAGSDSDLSCRSVQQILALDDGTVFAALDDGVYRSNDHGLTYSRSFPNLPNIGEETLEYVYSITFNPSDKSELFAATAKNWPIFYNRGSVWHSMDDGVNWTDITGDLVVKNVVVLTCHDGYLYAGTWCSNVYRMMITSLTVPQ